MELIEFLKTVFKQSFETIKESRFLQTLIYLVFGMNFIILMMSIHPRHYPLWSMLAPIWYFEGGIIELTFYLAFAGVIFYAVWLILPAVGRLLDLCVKSLDGINQKRNEPMTSNHVSASNGQVRKVASGDEKLRARLEEIKKSNAEFEALPKEEQQKILNAGHALAMKLQADLDGAVKAEQERYDAENSAQVEVEAAVLREQNSADRVRWQAINSLIGRIR